MDCEALVEIGTIRLPKAEMDRQRKLWKAGVLAPMWAEQFPQLFRLDRDWAYRSQPRQGYGYWEFLAAIILHHSTGYLSLWSRFPNETMPEKRHIVEELRVNEGSLLPVLADAGQTQGTQVPDLLMYSPDFKDWFFCEVKGPTDRLSEEQCEKFKALAAATRKPVRLLQFKAEPAA